MSQEFEFIVAEDQ